MKLRLLLVAALGAGLAADAFAVNKHPMAGCGLVYNLSSDARNNKSKLWQIIAGAVNGLWFNQAFSISSGTSGCTEEGLAKAGYEKVLFVEANFRTLSKELASGQGEFASNLASVMGCKRESVPSFLSFTQTRYGRLFPSAETTPVEMLNTLETELAADPALSKACSL